jgi:glycosyltransferase involved in cell wall biosynthesis
MPNHKTSISIVMPAYNEEDRLPLTLDEFTQWTNQNLDLNIELIIVDDGSTDKTEAIVQSYINKFNWIKLIKETHVGMMNAIFTGINNANYDLIGTLEADSPVQPKYFKLFLPHMDDFDIIIGSRFLGKKVIGKSLGRRIVSKVNSLLFTFLFTCPIKDPQISFRLYRKSCIQKILPMLSLKHDGFKSSEIVVKAHSLGFKLKEVPVIYNHDIDSRAVPGGVKAIKITMLAMFALFQLWLQSIGEYKKGVLTFLPVKWACLYPKKAINDK